MPHRQSPWPWFMHLLPESKNPCMMNGNMTRRIAAFIGLGLVNSLALGQGEGGSLSPDIKGALEVHNRARAEVGVAAMAWDEALATEAQAYAERLVKLRDLVHATDANGHGENLYWYSATTATPMTDASTSWYEEISDYRYRECCGPRFQQTGHYTQMIWHSTTAVGIGVAVSSRGETYVVARYNPPGNWQGQAPYPKR
jgi:pathogenesis-related protein 1